MKKRQFSVLFLIIMGWIVFAQPGFAVNGQIPDAVTVNPSASPIQASVKLSNGQYKNISLFKVVLPKKTRSIRMKALSMAANQPGTPVMSSALPSKVDLGMNGVKVLDQGRWGTCATFATAAAIDAFYPLKGGRMISELCNLQMGRTLNLYPDLDGGWEGSNAEIILNQISQYGYLPQSYQEKEGCGGLKAYPNGTSGGNGTAMPADVFTQNSIRTFTKDHWKPLLERYSSDPVVQGKLLEDVRQNLAAGYRVVFGVVLDTAADNNLGLSGPYKTTWVITPKVVSDINNDNYGGHEMVIIGYDDTACATYTDEKTQRSAKQCGLLKLRNSWGSWAGDWGDFYMTYDYFKNLTVESYLIGKSE